MHAHFNSKPSSTHFMKDEYYLLTVKYFKHIFPIILANWSDNNDVIMICQNIGEK